MLEYIITHMFDEFIFNLVKMKENIFFSVTKIHFWKKHKNSLIFTCDMSMKRS